MRGHQCHGDGGDDQSRRAARRDRRKLCALGGGACRRAGGAHCAGAQGFHDGRGYRRDGGGRGRKPRAQELILAKNHIQLRARFFGLFPLGDKIVPAGTVHCFACGYKANIVKLIADCLDCSYSTATDWLLGFADYDIVKNARVIDDLEVTHYENNYDTLPIITSEQLKEYDYIHPYMFERKFNNWAINKFEIGFDPNTKSLTFPVYVNGKCLFVAKRRVYNKYFELPKIYPKPLYGVDYLTNMNEVLVCESVIDAITCWIYGRQAIALFGTVSEEQIKMIQDLPHRSIVLALDNDECGKKGTKFLQKHFEVTRFTYLKGVKDPGEMTQESFDKMFARTMMSFKNN